MQTTVRETTGTVTTTGPGRVKLRIIDEGVGSSGIYRAEVLQKAAEERAFGRGTQMHLDHDTEEDRYTRPEGSLRNLVGVLTEDARFEDGALVAEARIGSEWRTFVNDFHEFVGVSISASAEVSESADGPIIERLIPSPLNRADIVTVAGRGGRITEVLEAAQRIQEQNPSPVPAGVTKEEEDAVMADTTITEALNRAEEANSRATALEAEKTALATELEQVKEALATERKEREDEAREARQAKALAAVESAFGENAPRIYTQLAESVSAPEDYDHDEFVEGLKEAAAAQASASGAGTPSGVGESHAVGSEQITPESANQAVAEAFGRTVKEA